MKILVEKRLSTLDRTNPFKIGDRVIFDPDARTIGWTWSSFDRLRIHPGDVGLVTKIVDDCIAIDDDRGGFHWECFKRAEDPAPIQRTLSSRPES
jgi:hypothetical protein